MYDIFLRIIYLKILFLNFIKGNIFPRNFRNRVCPLYETVSGIIMNTFLGKVKAKTLLYLRQTTGKGKRFVARQIRK